MALEESLTLLGHCPGAGGGLASSQQAVRLEPSPHAQLSGGFLQLQWPELLAGRSVTAMAYCPVAGSSLVVCAYAPVSMTAEQLLKVGGWSVDGPGPAAGSCAAHRRWKRLVTTKSGAEG